MRKIFILLMCIVLTGCGTVNETKIETGTVGFTVVDGLNGLPIEGVRIVVPESGEESVTDSDGHSQKLAIPIIKCGSGKLQSDCGIFTVLAFKENYNDYALFYAKLDANEERNMKIFMFMTDTPLSNGAPLSTVEAPDREWVEKIIKEYK